MNDYVLNSKTMLFWRRNINFEMENPPHFLTDKLCASVHIRNHELKVRLVDLELEKEKSAIFVMFILSEGNFFDICVLSRCIVC